MGVALTRGLLFSPKSCPTLCDPVDCSTPGSPALHYLPEFAQIHVCWNSDAVFNLFHRLLLLVWVFPSIMVFSSESLISSGQSIGASASVLPMNIQGYFLWDGPVGSPCSPRDSQESSPAPQFESVNSLALSLFYGPALISVHDCWEPHGQYWQDLTHK